jgi:hypothetical protein
MSTHKLIRNFEFTQQLVVVAAVVCVPPWIGCTKPLQKMRIQLIMVGMGIILQLVSVILVSSFIQKVVNFFNLNMFINTGYTGFNCDTSKHYISNTFIFVLSSAYYRNLSKRYRSFSTVF